MTYNHQNNDEHPVKGSFPKYITDRRLGILFKDEHLWKARSSMYTTDDENETLCCE